MQRLIVQLRETTSCDHLVADWWFFDGLQLTSQGNAISPEQMATTWQHLQQQAAFAKQGRLVEVVLFAPAHRVHMRLLNVSKGQGRHLNRVLPYLMEPFLGQSVDEMHFVAAPAQDEKVWAFAVAHSHMLAWQIWSAVFTDYRVSLFALPCLLSTTATEKVTELLGECFQFQCEQWCWLPKNLMPQQATSVLDGISVNQILNQSKTWARFNLLQARYQVRCQRNTTLQPWRWAAVLSLLAFSTYSLNTYLDTQSLNQQAQYWETTANQAFLKLLPEEGRVVNLTRQMAARLQHVREVSAEQVASAYEVLTMLDSVRDDTAKTQGLQSIAWQPQSYRFEWRANSRTELERIQQILSSKGVELEQMVRQEQGYLGVFRAQGVAL